LQILSLKEDINSLKVREVSLEVENLTALKAKLDKVFEI
jgi:hypothetical protein